MEQETDGEEPDNRRGNKHRDDPADDAQLPATLKGGALVIPSAAEMSRILAQVDQVEDMRRLHSAAATWETWTKQMEKASEEVAAIAEFRIRLERKIGQYLTQNVRRGRPTKRSARLTFSEEGESQQQLPPWINGQKSSQYRRLAAVTEERFDAYLAMAKGAGRRPSSKGLLRFALVPGASRTRGKAKKAAPVEVDPRRTPDPMAEAPPVPDAVIEAVKRFMQVDLLVGGDPKAFPKAQAVAAELLQGKQLRGDVFVAECPDPATWLPKLAAARTSGKVAQVIALVPAATGADWFKAIEEGKWVCCFPRSSNAAVLYAGERRHGFWAAFQALGAVLAPGYGAESN